MSKPTVVEINGKSFVPLAEHDARMHAIMGERDRYLGLVLTGSALLIGIAHGLDRTIDKLQEIQKETKT